MKQTSISAICLSLGLAMVSGSASANDNAEQASTWDRDVLLPELRPRHTTGLAPVVPLPSRPEPDRLQFLPPVQLGPSLMFQKSKSSRQMVELGNFSALFETSRAKTERSDSLSYFARPRVALYQTRATLLYDVTPNDTLALTASRTHEKRRPAIMIAQNNSVSANDRSFSLGWNHDDKFQLAISAYDVRPSRISEPATRLVELASGAPRASTGVALSLSLSPTGNRDEFSLGFNVRQQRAEWQEASTFGERKGEMVGMISARFRF